MTPLDLNAIYNLLPAVYRIRDANSALQGPAIRLDPGGRSRAKQSLFGNLNSLDLPSSNNRRSQPFRMKQQPRLLEQAAAVLAEQIEVLQQEPLPVLRRSVHRNAARNGSSLHRRSGRRVSGLSDFPGTPYSLRQAAGSGHH